MLTSLILALSAKPDAASIHKTLESPRGADQAQSPDEAEYERQRKLVDKDADKLWDLYDWCQKKQLDKQAKSCLRRIVQLKPDDEKAHKLLGEVSYEGKWFPSEKKVEEYKKQAAEKAAKDAEKSAKDAEKSAKDAEKSAKDAEKSAKDKGLVKYKDQWVTPEDLSNLKKGLVKNDKGEWIDLAEQKQIAEGWVKQDLEWISPQEKENIAKGLWKCGDKWLETEPANDYHSEFFQWWKIPHDNKYVLYTTCARKVSEQVDKNIANAYDDLVRCYGCAPAIPPAVIILQSQQQYESFAAGDQEEGRPPAESTGLSSTHYAFFADTAVNFETGEFAQWGVSYWDASAAAGPKWALHSTRNALGQSFAEALDPSTKTMEKITEEQRFDAKGFWEEKKIPLWFRLGAASFVERYFTDHTVGVGGNSRWAIEWSLQNLLTRGGMLPISQVLEYEPSVDKPDETQVWYNRVGLLMYFMIDGKCAPVTEKLVAFQTALKSGKDPKAVTATAKSLATEISKHDTDLRKFAAL